MSLASLKIYLTIISATVLAAFGVGMWLLYSAVTSTNEFATFPDSNNGERPTVSQGEMAVRSSTGYIVMKDVLEAPVMTYPGDIYVVSEEPNFSIVYFAQADQFLISLFDSINLLAAQQQAEAVFMELTKLSKEEACAIQVSVEVPFSIDFERSGEYGLSFCAGSVQLK